MLNPEAARQALSEAGVRITPQRLMVIDALTGNRTHPSVDQIYDIARRKYPTISLATVYHTVALLARYGLILELHGGKDGLRYDPDTAPHAHAYCQRCGAVLDLPLPESTDWQQGALDGFHTAQIEISLYGFCSACRQVMP